MFIKNISLGRGVGISLIMIASLISSGCITHKSINSSAAEMTVSHYESAKRNGMKTEQCLYARAAMRFYLQAQDDISLAKWKAVAENDCVKN